VGSFSNASGAYQAMDELPPHCPTYLAEVPRMVFFNVDSMMMQATSITTTTGMFSVLANTTVTERHMSSQLPCLPQMSCH
jgi:hypothetical protein